jgi:hypothetical protein
MTPLNELDTKKLLSLIKPGDRFFISPRGWLHFISQVAQNYDHTCSYEHVAAELNYGGCLVFSFDGVYQYAHLFNCTLDSSDSKRVEEWNNLVTTYLDKMQILNL